MDYVTYNANKAAKAPKPASRAAAPRELIEWAPTGDVERVTLWTDESGEPHVTTERG